MPWYRLRWHLGVFRAITRLYPRFLVGSFAEWPKIRESTETPEIAGSRLVAAVCGPECRVAWQGRATDRSPYGRRQPATNGPSVLRDFAGVRDFELFPSLSHKKRLRG
jgi:hypothetical protein